MTVLAENQAVYQRSCAYMTAHELCVVIRSDVEALNAIQIRTTGVFAMNPGEGRLNGRQRWRYENDGPSGLLDALCACQRLGSNAAALDVRGQP